MVDGGRTPAPTRPYRKRLLMRLLKQQRGQSLVEFSLIAPVLLLMLLGVSDLGRALYYYVTISNATFEGARVAAVATSSLDAIRAAVRDEASPLVTIQDSNITITPIQRVGGRAVTVTTWYDFSAVTPLISRIWGGGQLHLQSSATLVAQ